MAEEEFLDTTGLACPLPVLKARKRLLALVPGQILRLAASDPMAAIDIPHFCRETGHELLGASEIGGVLTFRIRRASVLAPEA